jgi:hypothetical protein
MKTITVGSKVKVIGAEDGEGKVVQIDLEGVAIVETKKKMIICLASELSLLK